MVLHPYKHQATLWLGCHSAYVTFAVLTGVKLTDFLTRIFLLNSSPGIVAFRQHLQNLARTKGILELNKVQLLYEQMGSEEEPPLTSTATQLQDFINSPPQVLNPEVKCCLSGVNAFGQIRR